MKQGFFDDASNEYVIPDGPLRRPMLNYLWNARFVCAPDNFGGGQAFTRLASGRTRWLFRERVNTRLVYLQDPATGETVCLNKPVAPADGCVRECRAGIGTQRFTAQCLGVRAEWTIAADDEETAELWRFRIETAQPGARCLRLVVCCRPDVNETPHCSYNDSRWDASLGGLLFEHRAFGEEQPYPCIYVASRPAASAWSVSEERFGADVCAALPAGMAADTLDCHPATYDETPAAALEFVFTVRPDAPFVLYAAAGLAASPESARRSAQSLPDAGHFERAAAAPARELARAQSVLTVQLPDETVQRLCNVWLKRQVSLGKTWARVYGKGVRDMLQDAAAFVSMGPDEAAASVLNCLAHQYAGGNTIRMFEPDLTHPYQDGPVWIPAALAAYLKETGDLSFLGTGCRWLDDAREDTVLEHMLRGLRYLLGERGTRGLVLWRGGDWNDSANAAGLLGKGESAWLTLAAVKACREALDILRRLPDRRPDDERMLEEGAREMRGSLMRFAWEGDRFLYGFTDWDEPVGSRTCAQGSFMLNPQTWAVLADILPHDEACRLLDRTRETLGCAFGLRQLAPPYTTPDDHIGRVTYFQPGCVENGSVYNHGVAFYIAAECALGRADNAWGALRAILPDNPALADSGVEPYAVTNMYIGPDNPCDAGFAPCSWITGTAGWLYRCITEQILGVAPDWDGLCVAPCLPSAWKEARAVRAFRGAVYDITVVRDGSAPGLTVDGRSVSGAVVPVYSDGGTHRVRCVVR